jgi:tetratricopeptide (TPR) repeat protein
MGLHDYEDALELLQRVLTYDPLFAPALYESALCYLVLGRQVDLALTSVRLKRLSPRWGRRLDQVIRNSVLQPRRVFELPRASVSAWPTAK